MNPIDHPATVLLIHERRIRDEQDRHTMRKDRERSPRDDHREGPGRYLRRSISHGLMSLARRIAPDEATGNAPALLSD